jgi:hypothetical protein
MGDRQQSVNLGNEPTLFGKARSIGGFGFFK